MKQFYRSLLPLVNEKDQMERLLAYTNGRIETLRNQLEKQKDRDRVLEIQGAITELRRFSTLRDEVIKEAE
jgi:hypothetical protein|tara:strand:- start:2613 stop:2825 length:213 start_codon:yes stop_codon:yes gene_type:complete